MRGSTGFAGVSAAALTVFLAAASARAQCTAHEVAHLLASDGRADDLLGFSVAIDGDTAIAGAMGYDTVPGPIGRQGAAYIFVRSARGGWAEQARLTASDGIAGDNFGISVAIHGDTAVVGAYAPTGARPGSAYIFTRSAGVWTERARLTASDGALFDYFGICVAIQGETVIVGASRADIAGITDAGAAYVFQPNGNQWGQRAKLAASDPGPEDHFGASIAIDGDTAAIGARDDNSPGGLPGPRDGGSVYIFTRAGHPWAQQTILAAPQPRFIGAFGYALSLTGDTLFIGEPDFSPVSPGPGAAYLFQRTAGAWAPRMQLGPSDGAPLDNFGSAIARSGDTAVVGAPRHNAGAGANSGAAYLFRPVGGPWVERAKLRASDAAPDDRFGISVAVGAEAILAGAVFDDTPAGANAGSAYIFEFSCGCYANCDGSSAPPVLNVNDFVCFQSRFAAGEPYADCDHSGAMNVNDFVCFQGAFAAGCR